MTATAGLSHQPTATAVAVRARTGLHGHSHDTHLVAVIASETIGTFFLVLAIAGAAVAAALAKPISGAPYGSLSVAVAGGAVLSILVAVLGPVSGGHFNPAVTLGLAASRKFPWSRVPVYVIGQFAGAIGAALAVWWLYGSAARRVAHLGATYPAARVSGWRAFGAEAGVTFLLALVIVIAATSAPPRSLYAPSAIGAALAAAILISGPISSAGVNPARAIGPMIATGRYTDWWVYLTAPLVGAALAVQVGITLLAHGADPVDVAVIGRDRGRT